MFSISFAVFRVPIQQFILQDLRSIESWANEWCQRCEKKVMKETEMQSLIKYKLTGLKTLFY